jgi:hypothetical protein
LGRFPFEWAIWIPFALSKAEIGFDRWRYELRRENDPLYDVLADWAAQVHFLYCSGLAVALATLINVFLCGAEQVRGWRVPMLVSAFVILAGLVHHVRYLVALCIHRSESKRPPLPIWLL